MKIFISYRHYDNPYAAGWICEHLQKRYGLQNVYLDVLDRVGTGPLPATLKRRIGEADVVIVIIGPRWLDAAYMDSQPRICQPDDYVRLELETALAYRRPLLPLLLEMAPMPEARYLPATLASFAQLKGWPVRPHPDFTRDMENLYAALTEIWRTRAQYAVRDPAQQEVISVWLEQAQDPGPLGPNGGAPQPAALFSVPRGDWWERLPHEREEEARRFVWHPGPSDFHAGRHYHFTATSRIQDADLLPLLNPAVKNTLSHLQLGDCRLLTDAACEHLCQLAPLQGLSLAQVPVTDRGVVLLARLTELRRLVLSGTQITNQSLRFCSKLPNLEVLHLGQIPLSDEHLEQLVDLKELRILTLSNTMITNRGLARLAALDKIQELHLHGCEGIDSDGLLPLGQWRHLELLDLSQTPVDDTVVPYLCRLKGLRWLNLDQTYVSEPACRHLQQELNLGERELVYRTRRRPRI